MVFANDKLYVTHRDAGGRGTVTAFGLDGSHTTVIGDLPAQGDYSVTDICVRPSDGRLFFAVGSATNSGVVGTDNWMTGWLRKHPEVCDRSYAQLELNGYRFDSKNPDAGLFGGPDIAVTAPYQPFGRSDLTTILPASDSKPNGAVFSISPSGGDLKVEAFGLHHPRGLAFGDYGRLYAVNDGMELRGTRPVKNDPDALVRILFGVTPTWYGGFDYSSDFLPISDPKFQEESLLRPSGYRSLRPLVDREASSLPNKLKAPDRELLLHGVFASQSGAAKLSFVPAEGPFKDYHGSAIVALCGDRAPFATSGYKLREYFGYRVVRVDVDEKVVSDFIVNTRRQPASQLGKGTIALERPIDVKFGPDGALYILDFGQMTVRNGKEKITKGTGKIFKLTSVPATRPSK
jgi:glucose/arabinose dehydrogenase